MVMIPVIPFLKLIRWQNLLLIAYIMYSVRLFVIYPMISNIIEGWVFDLQLSDLYFFLLVLSTVFIAAAGYIINDYFDLKIDRVNRPATIIVGKVIKRRVAMVAHVILNTSGIVIGIFVLWQIAMWKLIFIHLFTVISLWYYSTHFKYLALWGNIITALLSGLIPLIVGLVELPLLYKKYGQNLAANNINLNFIAYWIMGIAAFIFLVGLCGEIIKDFADEKGDSQYGATTAPVAFGSKLTKYVIMLLYFVLSLGVIIVHQLYLMDLFSLLYFVILVIIPCIFICIKLAKAKEREDFLVLVGWNKRVLIAGLLFLPFVYLTLINGPIL